MELPFIIEEKLSLLFELCEKFKVNRLFIFGSAATNHFNPKTSDIDLIVELDPMPPIEKGLILIEFWESLEDLFQRKVDLLTDKPIENPYLKKNIEATKRLIYDRESEKVSV